MYERNINVLEMFVEKKLGYVETNNIKNNYYDYKELVKILDDYINICTEENKSKQEYDLAVTNIQNIQKTKEKLYNQNVKFEYSRNILFADVNRKVEDIEKCLTKIESALDKNKDIFKTLRKNFIQGIIDLNEKSRALKKISRPKNKIETDYKQALELIKENYHSINPDDIELTKKFVESTQGFEEELIEKMIRNGKDEKIPFDKNAITSAAKLGLDIAQKEAENYLFMYEQTGKILNELETNKLKLDARKKHITDTNVKLSFLKTEKEYLVQFLDNERITAIQGEAEHNRLMKNCCKILKEDVAQINVLYDLIIKETKKRATNRCYEELYNKSYLEDIQEKEKDFINKTTNIDYANGTIISPNYWRIDSIKAIYENFDKNVYETYGRKFVAPKQDEEEEPKIVERVVERVVEKVVEKPIEKIIERVIEKPVEIVPENPEYTEFSKAIDNMQRQKVIQKAQQLSQRTTQKSTEQSVSKQTQKPAEQSELKTAQIATRKSVEQSTPNQTQRPTQKSTTKKAQQSVPKFRKVKRVNRVIEEDDSVILDEPAILEEESIFSKSKPKDDLDDIQAIIKKAEATISPINKKASIIKKIVKKNKGKYAED